MLLNPAIDLVLTTHREETWQWFTNNTRLQFDIYWQDVNDTFSRLYSRALDLKWNTWVWCLSVYFQQCFEIVPWMSSKRIELDLRTLTASTSHPPMMWATLNTLKVKEVSPHSSQCFRINPVQNQDWETKGRSNEAPSWLNLSTHL